MKKLLLLAFFCLAFLSCKNNSSSNEPTPIPRSEWDSDNIAFSNTDTLKTVGYKRKSGSNGIIGSFEEKTTMTTSMTTSMTYTYTFYETGYYEKKDVGISHYGEYINKIDTGTFEIKTLDWTDEYFWVRLSSNKGHGFSNYFYQVTTSGLYLTPYLYVDGQYVYP